MTNLQTIINTDLDVEIEKVEKLIKLLNIAENKMISLQFISIEDLAKAMNTSIQTAQNYFNMPDFPSTDFPKEKKAEIHAVIEFFSVPRRKKK